MRITSKGQVTIPLSIREECGLLPNTEVQFLVQKGQVILIKEETSMGRGSDLIRKMLSKPTLGMSTDDIMKLTRL